MDVQTSQTIYKASHIFGIRLDEITEPPTITHEQQQLVEERLAGGYRVGVSDNLMHDARYYLKSGGHREAIVLAYTAVEARASGLIRSGLQSLGYNDSRIENILRDINTYLRMDALLKLTTGFSLRLDAPDLWKRFQSFRNKRNRIVHEGESADFAQAQRHICTAVAIMQKLTSLESSVGTT